MFILKNLFLSDVNNGAEKPNNNTSDGEGYKKPTCDVKNETKSNHVTALSTQLNGKTN